MSEYTKQIEQEIAQYKQAHTSTLHRVTMVTDSMLVVMVAAVYAIGLVLIVIGG